MEFRILGSLVVCAGDETCAVGPSKHRVLLAALLVRANHVAPVDWLLAALWGETPPRSANSLLRVYVSGIRRLLARRAIGDSPPVLETRPGGYLLRLAPDELDAARFERHVDAAEQAYTRGELEPAAMHLRAGLALWRGGAALADVDSDLLRQSEGHRLEERRLSALDRHFEIDLRLGRHAGLVHELRSAVAEHPLREQWRHHFMVALYRSGRRAEALQVYLDTRRLLVEELGIEPGPDLARLQQAILTADPALAYPADSAGSQDRGEHHGTGGSAPPAQLPPAVATFTGRGRELAQLDAAFDAAEADGATAICAIDGSAGVGKSALAIHAAHRLVDRFLDGHLYVNLHGATSGLVPLAPTEVLGRFLRALGVAGERVPADLDEAAALFRSTVAGRRVLIVLDDAADAAQVRLLLPGGPGCAVLITSRRILGSLDGVTSLHLDVLPARSALDLLARLVGPARLRAEPDAAEALARLCGGLPLALRIAGARLAARPAWPLRTLVDRLTDHHHRLDELQVSDLAVRASFQVGYDALRAGSGPSQAGDASLFRLLGLVDGPDVAGATAGALLGCPPADAETALERLVDAHLLECSGPGRYRMHDLLRLFARERCVAEEPGPARAAALRRVLRWYVVTARRACALLYPGDGWRAAGGSDGGSLGAPLADKAAAMAWLEAERANLLAAARQASDGPEPVASTVGPLALALYRFLELGGYWHDLHEVNQLALGAARRAGDRRGEAQALNDLATAHRWLRRPDEAIAGYERSLAIWQQLGDRVGEGHALGNLGVQYHELGQVDTAVAYHARSLKIFREVGDRGAEGRALCNIGVGHEDRGRYDRAVACYEQALAIARELDDLGAQGYALTNLGDAHRLAGRPVIAATWYERSLSVHREVGDHYLEGEALCHLGQALHTLGEREQARARWREALDVFVALRLAAKADEVRALLAEAGQVVPAATAPRPG